MRERLISVARSRPGISVSVTPLFSAEIPPDCSTQT